MLLFALILFFIILIVYQIFLAYFQHSKIVEGMTTDTQGCDNTAVLVQQNAGNIEYLKQRIDAVQNMDQQIRDLSANVTSLSTQVDGLVQSQQQYATQISGGTPPTVTGTD